MRGTWEKKTKEGERCTWVKISGRGEREREHDDGEKIEERERGEKSSEEIGIL